MAAIFAWTGWQRYNRAAVIVEWTTASELDTVGFNLYRSETIDGSTQKVNPVLIPPSTDPMIGGDYSYQDDQVIVGKQYFYWLEDVAMDGGTSRHGPIEVDAQRDTGILMQILAAGALMIIACIGIAREIVPGMGGRKTKMELPGSNER